MKLNEGLGPILSCATWRTYATTGQCQLIVTMIVMWQMASLTNWGTSGIDRRRGQATSEFGARVVSTGIVDHSARVRLSSHFA